MNKNLVSLYKNLENQGWEISKSKNGAVKARKGDAVITLPGTMHDHRGIKNLVSQLRVRHNINVSI